MSATKDDLEALNAKLIDSLITQFSQLHQDLTSQREQTHTDLVAVTSAVSSGQKAEPSFVFEEESYTLIALCGFLCVKPHWLQTHMPLLPASGFLFHKTLYLFYHNAYQSMALNHAFPKQYEFLQAYPDMDVFLKACSLLDHIMESHGSSILYDLDSPITSHYVDNQPPHPRDLPNPLTNTSSFISHILERINLHVSSHGLISLEKAFAKYVPQQFPLSDMVTIIAPYWADVAQRSKGGIWYRQNSTKHLLEVASIDVRNAFLEFQHFSAIWMFVTTWEKVTFYQSTNKCGFNAGYGNYFYNVSWNSFRNIRVLDLPFKTNVGEPGVWMFRTDGITIQEPTGRITKVLGLNRFLLMVML
ncbi:Sushi, nidogen and EGF-like domain-containing protein 1 [Exaiptasia diaphana]|nr:Sushi, nidogen and EGF-like domain-containing protein 1 [Exaiptasia diaphana]